VDKDNDESLVERCRNGDATALEALVVRYQRPIYNAAFRVLGNGEDASDITQSVFLKVAERLDDYDPQYRFFSWIYRIALNESLNVLRRQGREESLDDESEHPGPERLDPERLASEAQVSRRVQGALMTLKIDHRAVLTLRHFSECSYREIAQILDLDEKTVKSRLFEARERLRELLGDLMPA
jgi:RNA polymerase sigma-70 factor (ECF subfamily)